MYGYLDILGMASNLDEARQCEDLQHSDLLDSSGQRGPKPPSAHRTVRTDPYTAPHARRIH